MDTLIPILVIAGTLAWSAISILQYRWQSQPKDVITLRIGHWQLEGGVRAAFEVLADDYAKQYEAAHPGVKLRVLQEAIPESIYGQWVSTQLMGGTAPDMVEIGLGLPSNIWLAYLNRYFHTMTPYVNRPNPYNKGTDLENTPLRMTVLDGMRSCYYPELQEYMSLPLAQFGVRVFYNRDLLKKLTGRDVPPEDWRTFKAVCDEIAKQEYAPGKHYVPIASSKYHMPTWEYMFADVITSTANRKLDESYDLWSGTDEVFLAIMTGRINFDEPVFRARFELVRSVTDCFQTGWMGVSRDEAVFLFAQQHAVFIATGTWDVQSLAQQAEGFFSVGTMNFPMPTADDPLYGPLVEGPLFESISAGFPFGVTRTSKHPELARDFLLYLMGRPANEKLNSIIGWIPSIRGAKVAPILEPFRPRLEGVVGGFSGNSFNLGGESWIRWMQLYSLFQVKKITFDELSTEFMKFYRKRAPADFNEQQRDWLRSVRSDERFITGIRMRVLDCDVPAQQDSLRAKYANQVMGRQVIADYNRRRAVAILASKQKSADYGSATGPYEYNTLALDNLRQQARNGAFNAPAASQPNP